MIFWKGEKKRTDAEGISKTGKTGVDSEYVESVKSRISKSNIHPSFLYICSNAVLAHILSIWDPSRDKNSKEKYIVRGH